MADTKDRGLIKQTDFGATEGMWKILRAEREKSRKESRAKLEDAGHKIYDSIEKIGEDLPKTPEEAQEQIPFDRKHWSTLKHSDIPDSHWFGAEAIPWEVRKKIRTDRKTGKPIGLRRYLKE